MRKNKITLKIKLIRTKYKLGKKIKGYVSDRIVSGIANIGYGKDFSPVKPSRRLKRNQKKSFDIGWEAGAEYKKNYPFATGDEMSKANHKARRNFDTKNLLESIIIAVIVILIIVALIN